jgi:maltooligosyltrehalose trehalohydrolase
VSLVLEHPVHRELALAAEPRGYFSLHVPGVAAGAHYRLRADDEPCADPASRFQPEGPFGPSQVIDPRDVAWTDAGWRGVTEPARQVMYELHVGTFTRAGTWAAASEQLARLAELGITTIEMMPVNEFAGARGWGYDGVNLFAPTHRYGTPADLCRFVDAAHAVGLAVILDVVYNHLGPAGNTLARFAPYTAVEPGEWGAALDYANPGVRELLIANASYWIDEFHLDGLRLDATQAIQDESRPHILGEVVRAARAAATSRAIFVVGENEPQDAMQLAPIEQGGCGLDALWNDDFAHAARVAATGLTDGYLHDYRGTPQELISAVTRGFLYQGQVYAWQNQRRGTPTRGLSRARFVHYLENHDQVANVATGERLIELTDAATLRALTALVLLGPELPMLFQGQEWGCARRWHYFVDHDRELNAHVRAGRAQFVAQFACLATPEAQALLPDPAAAATFAACVLDAPDRASPWYALHRDLLALRRSAVVFTDPRPDALAGAVLSEHAFCLRWWHETGDRLLLVNLGPSFSRAELPEPLLAAPPRTRWRIAWSSEDPRYRGHGTPEPFTRARLAIPARAAVLFDTAADEDQP